jgi:hypothetical protein
VSLADLSQVAYTFDPEQDGGAHGRPSKKRRVGKGSGKNGKSVDEAPMFVPLLNGAEGEQFVRLRQRRFEESWGLVDDRIQVRSCGVRGQMVFFP